MDPPDFNVGSIADMLAGLTDEDIGRLGSIAAGIMGEAEKEQEQESTAGGLGIDPELIFRLMNIMQRLGNMQNDARCNLISALKPLLSPEKRQRADRAIELLRLMSIFALGDIFGTE